MSEKTYVFDSGAGNNNVASMLPALLQNKGVDPAYLMGMMNNGGGFGNFGINEIIALVVIAAIFGGGNGNGIFGGGNNRSADTELIMQTLNRNGVDIGQLAQAVNCSTDQILAGINQVSLAICNLGNQMGQNTNQILTSIMQGNNALTTQICDCCFKTQSAIQESNFLTERGFCNTNQILTRGFSDLGYAFANQTCDLKQNANANTNAIIAKLDAIEDSRKDRELAEKDRVIATLTARSERQAELQPIYTALQEIKCDQPPVKKITCQENYIPVNTGINAHYGLIPTGYGCGCGYGYPFGFNGNGSLWG